MRKAFLGISTPKKDKVFLPITIAYVHFFYVFEEPLAFYLDIL